MDLFTYLMSKKGQNTQRDLFSYLLGKGSGGGGTYTTYTGTSLNISNSIKAQIKNFMLNSTELTQDGTPTPTNPIDVNVITGENTINICNKNIWDEETQIGYYAGSDGTYFSVSGQLCSKNFTKVNPNTTYYYITPSVNGSAIRGYDKNKNYIGSLGTAVNSFVTPNNCYYIKINLGSIYGGTYNNNVAISLNSTEYVPHQEQNYPITLGSKNLFNPDYYLNQNFAKGVYKYTLSDVVGNRGLYFTAKIKKGKSPINGLYVALSDNGYNPNRGTQTILSVVNGQIEQTHHYKDFTGINNIYISFNPTSLTWAQIDEVYEFSITTEYVNNLEYCKIGDYADQIFKNTTNSPYYDNTLIENEWYLKKNINKVILNGSENWLSVGTFSGFYAYYLTLTNVVNVGQEASPLFKSDRFHYVNGTSQAEEGGAYLVAKNYLIFVTETTVSNLKTWMGTNNVILYYQLETPTYIHISQEDYPTLKAQLDNLYNNAKSYDEQTNITQTNDDLPFNISVDVKVS